MAAICSLAAFSEVASSELSLRWYNRCRAHQVRSLSLPQGLRAPEPRGIFGQGIRKAWCRGGQH
jgi:hypothetical protein